MTLISRQVLELSWHDAWMHEARGPHGEWVKGPGTGLVHEAYGHGTVTAVKGKAATVRFDDGSVRRFGSLQEHEPVGEEKYFRTHVGPTDGDVPDPEHIDLPLAPEIPSVDRPWGEGGPWQAMDKYMIPYTTRGNAAIEAALRRGEVPDKPMDVEAVDRVIAKRHLTQDTTLYRGIGLSPELRAKLQPGAAFSDKSYTSTSTAPQWADEFANFRITGTAPWANGEMKGEPHPGWEPARMVLHARKGQEIGPGEPGLAEYILPRDSNFKVTAVTRGADGMTEIHADVLPVTAHTALKPVSYPDPRDRLLKRHIDAQGRVIYDNSNVELGWRYNPLEKRNKFGEWTRGGVVEKATGAQYRRPPADRFAHNHARASDNPFINKYGLSAGNVVASYDASTADEREQGMRWYADAHEMGKMMAGGDADKGAALLSAYSPQTDWASDSFNAARTLADGRPPEHGIGITGATRTKAQAILDATGTGEIEKLFPEQGSSKTRAFYHLIRNGGDLPGDPDGEVVIDRHALSVAAGRRLTTRETAAPTNAEIKAEHPDWTAEQAKAYKATFPADPTSSPYTYQHVGDMYREAAARIRERDGTDIAPHQLQAITWLHQINANNAEDAKLIELGAQVVAHGGKMKDVPGAANAKGQRAMGKAAWKTWMAYARAHQVPLHTGTTAVALSRQLNLGWTGYLAEPRDSHGRWTRFGGVGKAVTVMEREREGFSVSPRTGESPTGGYMVALDGHTHRYPASILDDPGKLHRALDDMLMSERESFQGGDMYLGGWVEDGKLWLDPSQNVQDRAEAERLGRERDQVGIFDLNTFNTIDTGGSGGGRIIDHANQGPRQGAGQLLGPAGGGAAGGRGATGRRHPRGIAAQVREFAGGRHDAWRHELRDSHGRWTRGLAEAIDTATRQQMFNSLSDMFHEARQNKRAEADDIRNAMVALSMGQDEEAAMHLGIAAGVNRYAGDPASAARAQQLQAMADKIRGETTQQPLPQPKKQPLSHPQPKKQPKPGLIDEYIEAERAAIGKFMGSVDQAVPKLLGGRTHLDWDHEPPTIFDDNAHPNYLAYIDWNGHVNFSQSTADGLRDGINGKGTITDPDAFVVSLHEFIHTALPAGQSRLTNGDMTAYQDPAHQAIEEGFTELAATHHAAEFFKAAGIGDRPTPILSDPPVPDREWAARVNRFASLAEKKADQLGESIQTDEDRRRLQPALDGLRTMVAKLRKDPYEIDAMTFDDPAMGWLLKAEHTGDTPLAEWARRMRAEGQDIQNAAQDRHLTMAEYAQKMADPKRIRSGDSWQHYDKWKADAYNWTAEIAKRLNSVSDPAVIKKLADQISGVGTAAKPRIMAEQLLAATGIHDLTREQKFQALQSAEDQIVTSWGREAPANVAALATGKLRSTVAAMRGEVAAA